MPQDRKGEVALPQGAPPKPFVHPGAPPAGVDYAAIAEASRRQRQQANAVPKARMPVAGGVVPPIPNLAGAPQQSGMTMAQHAAAERGVVPQAAAPEGGGFVEPAATLSPNQVAASPASLGLLPTDELPPEAKNDPNFISGTGSMFASNQPGLAAKYGVIRRGALVSPQQLRGGQKGQRQLRPETVRDLEELGALQKKQEQVAVPPTEESTELGRAAATAGTEPTLSNDDKKDIKEAIASLDGFDFDQHRQASARDIINNPKQRELIESRLKPMDVGDLITQGFLIQRVEVIPGKLFVEFKTIDAETDLAIKRLIMDDSASVEVSDRYYFDKFSLMSIAAHLHKINDRPFGDFVDERGNFDDNRFMGKFNKMMKLPLPLIASLGANTYWFDVRVRKLFVAEAVGNG